ncbi:S9 family peptidase [Sandaracinobacteroides hominis]|uniref:S9 family peptidase n=1 Tax=Sandaracinobacteroides hominis TaxID=2780086 RepID=UPI0018F42D85|nr:prolyl oligopeptidase family serine peptidase [Sandaracinobacteroides hominis]
MRILAPAIALCLASAALAQAPTIRQQGSARLENVPAIPADVSAAVQLYQNSRAAELEDWLADGSMLVATRFGETRQLHHVAAPGAARTQLTFGREPISSATAIPGTNSFILGRDTGGDEWFQLYLKGLTGPARLLTRPGTRNQSPVVSKDGRLLVWSQAVKGSGSYALLAIDPSAPAEPRLLLQADGAVGPADIAADGKSLLYVRNISNRENQIFRLDIASGQSTRIAPDAPPARYESPRLLGDSILAISDQGSDTRRLVRIDPASGKLTPLLPALNWDVEEFTISPDGRTLAYAVNEDGYSSIHLFDVGTGKALGAPAFPKGVLTGLKFSPDGSKLAAAFTSARSAGDIWSLTLADDKVTRWTSSELGELDAAKLAEPRLIRFKSFDGLSVPAFVYRPAGIAPGVRTPVIIDIHGGPEAQTRPIWNYGAQYFADTLQATVILPNVRGSDGYGKRYLNLDNAAKREDSVKDIGALLDWVKAQPDLDAARVAVYGQSYGGYMSLAVMTHYSDRLVGGVERYGISDFASFLNNTEAYRRDNRRAEYGDERDPQMQKVFARISPMANIAKISKPMLVMQGANDPRVPQSESDQVVAKLRANGVETWYVLFADEGHGFQKKPNNDLRREVETVFLKKLFSAGEKPRT